MFNRIVSLTVAMLLPAMVSMAQESTETDLAKQSQNPLGTLISMPFELNTYYDIGPADATAHVLNLKPVLPAKIGNYNLINRFILPYIWSEGQGDQAAQDFRVDAGYPGRLESGKGSADGFGDLTYQGFISPAEPKGGWILGAGPVLVAPTATEDRWAGDQWSGGLAAVGLTMPGNWLVGVLFQNVWSITGEDDAADVNRFLFQYFLNYNFDDGWYLSSSPVMTADWETESEDRWTIPVGGGLGKLARFGKLPVDFKLAAYYNLEKPQFGSDWAAQFTVKFLFPK